MSDLKQIARKIFHETLAAIDIPATMRRKLDRVGSRVRCGEAVIDLAEFDQVHVVAFGKAAHGMTAGLLEVLAPDIHPTGIIVAPTKPAREMPDFRVFVGGHPVPNAASLEAGRAILDLAGKCNERALIFFLLSGGGSTLVEQPLDPAVSLADIQELNRVLVTCGAPIDEINAVRKHLSAIKGGRLAAAAPRAMKLTYGVSDVPQGRESALASGPTLPDPTTVREALRVVEQYGLLDVLPARISSKFARRHSSLPETPKPEDHAFDRAHFTLLLATQDLFHSAHRAAEAAGFITVCDNSTDDLPVGQAVENLLRCLEELRLAHSGKCLAVIADGEVSSPVTGIGIGGRNSAFVLACVEMIAGKGIAVLSAGTDGIDGNSPAAGAVADGTTLARARAARLDPQDYFNRSDSHSFFKVLSDDIVTGPTGNNLRDLRILLAEPV